MAMGGGRGPMRTDRHLSSASAPYRKLLLLLVFVSSTASRVLFVSRSTGGDCRSSASGIYTVGTLGHGYGDGMYTDFWRPVWRVPERG